MAAENVSYVSITETISSATESMFNSSTMNTTVKLPTVYDLYGHYNIILVSVLFSIISFVGLVGNTLVFVAVGLSRKLHNITNAFIVNLTICDFISCTTYPFHVVAVTAENGWPLADWYCAFIGSISIVTMTCSILTLAVISFNRWVLITKQRQQYIHTFTDCKVAMFITGTWLFPIVFLLLPQFFLGGLGYQDLFKICIWDSQHPLALIFQGVAALAFVFSSVVIVFSYMSIYRFVKRHMKVMENKQGNEKEATTEIPEEESSLSDGKTAKIPEKPAARKTLERKKTISKKQIDITKNLCLVVVTFFICVVPYTIHLPTGIYDMRGTYLAIIFMTHACLNPIIYAAKHPHFKVVFKCMFTCRYSDIPMPTRGLKRAMTYSSSMYAAGASSTEGGRYA